MLACLSELTLILGQGTMSSVSTRPTCLCPVCPRGATYLPCQHWLGRLASSWPLQGHLLMVTSPLSTFYTANILSQKGTGCTGNSKVNTQEEEEEGVKEELAKKVLAPDRFLFSWQTLSMPTSINQRDARKVSIAISHKDMQLVKQMENKPLLPRGFAFPNAHSQDWRYWRHWCYWRFLQTWYLSKKFTRPNFQAKEFYTLKTRKSRPFSPTNKQRKCTFLLIWSFFVKI